MTEGMVQQADTHAREHGGGHEEDILGMWLFLAGEVLFFGALFAVFWIYRGMHYPAFAEASGHLNVTIGAANTAILLTSSLSMALAVRAVKRNQRRAVMLFLALTVLLGIIFLGLKGVEYSQEFSENLYPSASFEFPGQYTREARLFFSLYFFMTGLHAAHMLAGMGVLSLLAFLAWRRQANLMKNQLVELAGLFWHFIDLVWIFLFPTLYLAAQI